MNVGTIITPTAKGQIVIPHKIRISLGISADTPLQVSLAGEAVVLRPVRAVITQGNSNAAVLDVLTKTAGSWADDDWPNTATVQKKIELDATKKRKHQSW